MLLSYKFNNFCSFDKTAEFDLLAPNNKVKNRFPDNYIVTDKGYDVLKVAVVIGENAGGKTNFINSISYLKSMFESNKTKHSFRSLVNINNLKTDEATSCNTNQEFDISIIGKSGLIYHYNLIIDEFCIVEEKLTCRNKKGNSEKIIISVKRKMMNISEEKSSVTASYNLKVDDINKDVKKILDKSIFSNGEMGLFVSKLAILGDERAAEFVNWMNEELIVESKNYNYYLYKNIQIENDDLRIIKDEHFLDILRMVDYSICGIEVDEEKPFRKTKIIRKLKNGEFFSRELGMDSGGVGEFFAWAVQLYRVVYEDKTVFADEMDRVINPILAERIVAFINGKKHEGQFIFSSHNVLHLDLKNYMKEQIYFVTKDKFTLNSELYSLADFPEIRYDTTKIYEFYMKGILGGTAFE